MITIEIPGLPKIITNGSKGSWRGAWAESKKWHNLVRLHAIRANLVPIAPLQKARLILTRFSSVEPDFDGLCGSFKHCIDGLVKAGILENDKVSNIGQPEYRWEKASPKKGMIKIEVEPITQAEG